MADAPITLITCPEHGTPLVADTVEELNRCAELLRGGSGPVAIDTERASGYRYGQRAFLVQIKREGAGTWLIDPEAFSGLDTIQDALRDTEWILHAASQDLPCLSEQGLWPDKLFDTELAGRLCGYPKVGLSTLLEEKLNIRLAKEHSAADWSQRPIPESMRNYAALDVEYLVELRAEMISELREQGKLSIAAEEFEAIRTHPVHQQTQEPWRKMHGIRSLKKVQQLTVARELWSVREKAAENRDLAPTKILRDVSIIAAAKAQPKTIPALLKLPKFAGRYAAKDATRWITAIRDGQKAARNSRKRPTLADPAAPLPPTREWQRRNPDAAHRLSTSRPAIAEVGAELNIPGENMLEPHTLREICWDPPQPMNSETIEERLRELGARPWQIKNVLPLLTETFLQTENPPVSAANAK